MRPYRMTATLDCSGQVCVPDVRPAPSIAVERLEKAVVRAAIAWDLDYHVDRRLLREIKKLKDARTRARSARKTVPHA